MNFDKVCYCQVCMRPVEPREAESRFIQGYKRYWHKPGCWNIQLARDKQASRTGCRKAQFD